MSAGQPLDTGRDGPALAPRLIAVAAVVVVLFGLHAVAGVVSLVLLSVLATIILAPLQAAMRQRGSPGWIALSGALIAYIGVLGAFGLVTAVGLADFLRDLPSYRDELDALLADLGVALGGPGAPAPVDPEGIETFIRGVVAEAMGVLGTVGYSVFVIAYLLLEAPGAGARVRSAFGEASEVTSRGAALARRLYGYIVARAILGGAAAILDVMLLLVLGVPQALLWGVLSFALSFIPNVGFILALIPPTFLALLTGGWGPALAVVVGYSVINVAIDYAIQPRYVGSTVDLAPVVVTVCILFWAVVLGSAGALLAVPATIIAAAVLDAYPGSRGLARLLGQGKDARRTSPPMASAAQVPAVD